MSTSLIRSPPPAPSAFRCAPGLLVPRSLTRGHHRRSAVRRYLRHVLPRGLHSVRYCGFHHPAARKTRLKVMLLSGRPVDLGNLDPTNAATTQPTPYTPECPCCGAPMILLKRLPAAWKQRHPSARPPPQPPPIPA